MPLPTTIDLNDNTPAAPTGRQNIQWQGDDGNPRNVSANFPTPFYLITFGVGIGSPVVTGTDVTPHYVVPAGGAVPQVTICAKEGPTGSALIVDVLENGTSLTGGTGFTLPGGSTLATLPQTGVSVTTGAVLSFNVNQVGSTAAGQDVTVQLIVENS